MANHAIQARKKPRQARSRATVEAMVEATARILSAEGFEAVTTNRVAEVAGVSVGSLYQYFPNKEALIAALIERHVEEEVERLERLAPNLEGADLETLIRGLIAAHIEGHRRDPALSRALHRKLPQMEHLQPVHAATCRVEQLVQRLCGPWLGEDPALGAFLLVNAVELVVERALLDRPEMFGHPGFVDELTALALAYLERSAAGGGSACKGA